MCPINTCTYIVHGTVHMPQQGKREEEEGVGRKRRGGRERKERKGEEERRAGRRRRESRKEHACNTVDTEATVLWLTIVRQLVAQPTTLHN